MNFLDPVTFSDLNIGFAFLFFSQYFSSLSLAKPVEKYTVDVVVVVVGRLFNLLFVVVPLLVAGFLGAELDFFAVGVFLAGFNDL